MTDNMKKIHDGLDILKKTAVLKLRRIDLDELRPDEFRLIMANFATQPFLNVHDFCEHLDRSGVVPNGPHPALQFDDWTVGDVYPTNYDGVIRELINYLEKSSETD